MPVGSPKPRIAPPLPARSQWREMTELAKTLGLDLYPWQQTAARYLTAKGPGDRWVYPEVAVIVGRQNGKTTLLLPLIISRLRDGQRIMHTAQNRELPREVHDKVATLMLEHFRGELKDKRGIRYGSGQEEIALKNGGHYRIVAPTRGGARGPSNDTVIIDELREMDDHGFIAAAEPTLSASRNPQMVYLSNAGTEESVVLNALRRREGADPALAYLEWSAAPERARDDVAGWCESNPAIGHQPGRIEYLSRKYESYRLAETLGIFETEHLCRWVGSTRQEFLSEGAWLRCRGSVEAPKRPAMAMSLDPSGERASAAIAWRQADDTIALRLIADVTGSPLDVERLGADLRDLATELRVTAVAHDPWTQDLARYFRNARLMSGREFANASSAFVRLAEAGLIRWTDADAVGADLAWTGARALADGGKMATVISADHPITGVLAAIRAVWLVSGPKPPAPRIL